MSKAVTELVIERSLWEKEAELAKLDNNILFPELRKIEAERLKNEIFDIKIALKFVKGL